MVNWHIDTSSQVKALVADVFMHSSVKINECTNSFLGEKMEERSSFIKTATTPSCLQQFNIGYLYPLRPEQIAGLLIKINCVWKTLIQ